MKKQTSVDFLIEEFSAILGKVNFTAMQGLLIKDAVKKAREIHEIEIMEAFDECGNWQDKYSDSEHYYNKTYKKEEK
jgi:hypothetical protein